MSIHSEPSFKPRFDYNVSAENSRFLIDIKREQLTEQYVIVAISSSSRGEGTMSRIKHHHQVRRIFYVDCLGSHGSTICTESFHQSSCSRVVRRGETRLADRIKVRWKKVLCYEIEITCHNFQSHRQGPTQSPP